MREDKMGGICRRNLSEKEDLRIIAAWTAALRITAAGMGEKVGITGIIEKIEKTGITETIEKIEKTETIGITETTEITEAAETVETPEDTTARGTDRTGDNHRQEEAMVKMPDIRATGRTDIREMAGRVLKTVRMIAVVRELVKAAVVISTVVRATAEAMEGRAADTETINRVRDSWEKRLRRIWRKSARKIRDAQTARRKTNVLRKTISMKKIH